MPALASFSPGCRRSFGCCGCGSTNPRSFARIHRLLAWPELMALRLGVEPRSEPSLAGRTLGYDLHS